MGKKASSILSRARCIQAIFKGDISRNKRKRRDEDVKRDKSEKEEIADRLGIHRKVNGEKRGESQL